MKIRIDYLIVSLLLFNCSITSCKKYLDERSDKSLVIPQNIKQLQGILDNIVINYDYPVAGKTADDDTYFTDDDWNAIFYTDDRKNYVWDPTTDRLNDWYNAYQRIAKANVVLSIVDELDDPSSTESERNNVKGSALFIRALNFYELAQIFSPQYSITSASQPYGIPLKISPNIDEETQRSTVQETYDQIIQDLKESVAMLPPTTEYKTRPSKTAAYGLLARIYLVMGDYDSSLEYADLCLQTNNALLDYNAYPFSYPSFDPLYNDEVIFATESIFDPWFTARVSPDLYNLYDDSDLRKSAFFMDLFGDGTNVFIGSYGGTESYQAFGGIATDEIYLIRAESYARKGNVSEALDDVNTLMSNRWITGTFIPYETTDANEALQIILLERRKELVFRPSLRWSDLRRLNLDSAFAVTLERTINGVTYALPPNDLRYVFLIPASVIELSNIEQNPR